MRLIIYLFGMLLRYSTIFHHERVNKMWRQNGQVLNSCQKPIQVIGNILDMFSDRSSLIVDVTCGSGTTAVS